MAVGQSLSLAYSYARRELRGGLKGFRIFLACILLGVAAIAGVGSLADALLDGLEKNGRALLGGEVELRLIHREATAAELTWLRSNSARLSATAELRTMARAAADRERRRLAEMKAVDQSYPLYGTASLVSGEPLQEALENRDGRWGAVADRGLLNQLDLEIGDEIVVGETTYRLRGEIEREPDRGARAVTFGPRLMIPLQSLEETGLLQPGSLIYFHYRVEVPEGESLNGFRERLEAALPKAGWRIRDLENAAPGIERLVNQVALFMTLVGLTSLLVGGVGVANAVRSYLDEKKPTIATFKCLGAPGRFIFQVYLIQVLLLSLVGICGGLLVGAVTPTIAGPLLSDRLNYELETGVYWGALGLALLFGLLTTLVFSLWPLARAQTLPAGSLFRDLVAPGGGRPPLWAQFAVLLAAAALAATAVLGTADSVFAIGFIAGAVAALLTFRLAAQGIVWAAKRLPRAKRPSLRLALANLHRPGNPTANVVMSLGLGLTVLVAIALIQGNLNLQVIEELPEEAPGFYFIDIQPEQVAEFDGLIAGHPGTGNLKRVPMLRGRIVGVNGKSPDEIEIPESERWVFQGDRGITWARERPDNNRITAGEWWPADYDGPPLISVDDDFRTEMGLEVGDSLTLNILGRDVEAEIASFRAIDWRELKINFIIIFSPGMMENAPQSHIATVQVSEEAEDALEKAVTDRFTNVSAIRVKEAVKSFGEMLENVATAVRATAGVTLLAGVFVLAGAVAAGHHRRIYDAVVLKVLGATRPMVARAFLLEYGLIGLATAFIAAVVGTLAAYIIMLEVMRAERFVFLPLDVLLVAAAATGLTLLFGLLGTWRALSHKAAPLLRNE